MNSFSIQLWLNLSFFKKNGPIPASFCLFSSFSHYNFNNTNWKKHSWCAWDSNPGPQDGRRRRNHGAMAATQVKNYCCSKHSCFSLKWSIFFSMIAPKVFFVKYFYWSNHKSKFTKNNTLYKQRFYITKYC